ncbi:RagB/SusD family nutrient uptake outer membrane protein [Persicobacter diffluens]|uniref:Membrane protein n=1 Tax=Persicobacter diffluens TaxID=981 RepID=A0AAN4W1N0_9BACT|nr:membrane protein [Persicobacter diffluens]
MRNFLILCLSLSFMMTSCSDFLDREQANSMSPDDVFNSPDAIEAYFISLYKDLPIESFNFCQGHLTNFPGHGNRYLANWTQEAVWSTTYGGGEFNSNWNKCYTNIRRITEMIKILESGALPDKLKDSYDALMGEALFLRAYNYFTLAKMFGGVPLITELLDPTTPLEELMMPRDTELAVWNLIAEDLEFAAANMPEESIYGRANKYVAAALLSRSMIFAASVAQYGQVQLDGIVGVPISEAERFYKLSIKGAEQVINSGKYGLMTGPDPAQAFYELFVYPDNQESIFVKGYDFPATRRTHSHDLMILPAPINAPLNYGGRLSPTLQMVEAFGYTDGSSGELKIYDETGAPIVYENPEDIFNGKDPRMFGSFITTNSMAKGTQIVIQDGVAYRENGNLKMLVGRDPNLYFDVETKDFVETKTDILGTGNALDRRNLSGVFAKKYMDPERPAALCLDWRSQTHWIDIRYAEILLNHAEANFQLGNNDKALSSINQVRARAGMPAHEFLNFDKIKNEWLVEFVYENKYFWNLRRWRSLVPDLNTFQAQRIRYFYDIDNDGYIYKVENRDGMKNYQDRHYYNTIPGDQIQVNPLLVQNPGY